MLHGKWVILKNKKYGKLHLPVNQNCFVFLGTLKVDMFLKYFRTKDSLKNQTNIEI